MCFRNISRENRQFVLLDINRMNFGKKKKKKSLNVLKLFILDYLARQIQTFSLNIQVGNLDM